MYIMNNVKLRIGFLLYQIQDIIFEFPHTKSKNTGEVRA